MLLDAKPFDPRFDAYLAGHPDEPVPLERIFDELLELIAERDPDFYEVDDGRISRMRERGPRRKKRRKKKEPPR